MNGKKIRSQIIVGSLVVVILLALTFTGVITTSQSPDGKANVIEDVSYWAIQQGSFEGQKENCRRIANIDPEQEKVTIYKTAFQVTYPDFSLKKYLQQRPEDIIYRLSETTYLFYSTDNIPSATFFDRLSRGQRQASL
jgi:hypothetical protein